MLETYWWPGNIRELENLIERLVAITDKDWITDDDLPFEFHVAELDRDRARRREPASIGRWWPSSAIFWCARSRGTAGT